MTANELLEEDKIYKYLSSLQEESVLKLMRNYAKLKCAEQRQICNKKARIKRYKISSADEYIGGGRYTEDDEYDYEINEDSILNAPEPTM